MSIPKSAKKVFSGEIFDVYQWPQKMFDRTTKIFERVRRRDTVAVIATVGEKIIILKQRQPGSIWYYDLVGGRIDMRGASPRKYALSELLEETGMKPQALKLYKKFQIGGHVEYTISLYIAQNCKQVAEQSLDGGERIQIEYCSFDALLKLTDRPDFYTNRVILDHLLKARLDSRLRKALKNEIFS